MPRSPYLKVLLLSPAIIAVEIDIEDRHLHSATSPYHLQNLLSKQRKTRCIKHLQDSCGGYGNGKSCFPTSKSSCKAYRRGTNCCTEVMRFDGHGRPKEQYRETPKVPQSSSGYIPQQAAQNKMHQTSSRLVWWPWKRQRLLGLEGWVLKVGS